MQSGKAELLAEVAGYYNEKLAQYGETAKESTGIAKQVSR